MTVDSPLFGFVCIQASREAARTSLPRKLRIDASAASPCPLLRLADDQGNSETPTHLIRGRLPAGIDRNPVGGVLASPFTDWRTISQRGACVTHALRFTHFCVCGQSLRLCTLTPSSLSGSSSPTGRAPSAPTASPCPAGTPHSPLGPHLTRCFTCSLHHHHL